MEIIKEYLNEQGITIQRETKNSIEIDLITIEKNGDSYAIVDRTFEGCDGIAIEELKEGTQVINLLEVILY